MLSGSATSAPGRRTWWPAGRAGRPGPRPCSVSRREPPCRSPSWTSGSSRTTCRRFRRSGTRCWPNGARPLPCCGCAVPTTGACQLRAFAEPVTDAGGRVTGLRGAYQDVSAEYHTQLAFAAARDQLAEAEQRADEEHRLALRLQEAITPRSPSLPEATGIDVAARYRPAAARSVVGGDWYDTATLADGELLLAVGDVAGHGLDAVNGMVMLRNGLRGLAVTGQGPATMLGWLNRMACQFADGLMATAVCGRYEPASRILRWARAGHLPPVLVRDGEAAELPSPPGLLLGADPRAEYGEVRTELCPGDLLLLYTDGLIERRSQPIDESLAEFLELAREPVPSIGRYADYLLRNSPSDSDDDTCLVVVRVR